MFVAFHRRETLVGLVAACALIGLGFLLMGLSGVTNSGISALSDLGSFADAIGLGVACGAFGASAWTVGLDLASKSEAGNKDTGSFRLQIGITVAFALLFLGGLLNAFNSIGNGGSYAASDALYGLGWFVLAGVALAGAAMQSIKSRNGALVTTWEIPAVVVSGGFLLKAISDWISAIDDGNFSAGENLAIGIVAAIGYLIIAGGLWKAAMAHMADTRSLGLIDIGLVANALAAVLIGLIFEMVAEYQTLFIVGYLVMSAAYLIFGWAAWQATFLPGVTRAKVSNPGPASGVVTTSETGFDGARDDASPQA